MKFPKIIKIGDATWRVKKSKYRQTKFKQGFAYTLSPIEGHVYPFRGEIDDKAYAYLPGIYIYQDEVMIIRPKTDQEKNVYSVDRIIELSPDKIFSELSDNIEVVTEPIITDGDVFKPEIKSDDDIILAGMKYCIGNKNYGRGINFNAYGNRFPDSATKNNGRRAITYGKTMKVDMASRFGEAFDINIMAGFWDKDNCANPMSDKKTLYVIFNDDVIDLRDPELEIKVITRN